MRNNERPTGSTRVPEATKMKIRLATVTFGTVRTAKWKLKKDIFTRPTPDQLTATEQSRRFI